jgi:Protein of unknown function (DUF2975)
MKRDTKRIIATTSILATMHITSWIIFIGLCLQAGVFLFNIIYSLAINPGGAKYFPKGIDFSSLYRVGAWYFFAVTSMIVLVAAIKAYMFYLILSIFKILNLVQPFSKEVGRLIFKISFVALLVGILSLTGFQYSEWLVRQHVKLPEMYTFFGGGDVFLFMAATLFVIALVFQRGIEIQSENELTV